MNLFDNDTGSSASQYKSVSELTREIKYLLENALPPMWIVGEISNFKHHSSGHMYFSLKDENATIPGVMWRTRNARLFFTPRDGMKVLAYGQINVYEKRGTYQLNVQQMQPAGVGELQLAFEELKTRLREEGLFDPEFKKPLPAFPRRIGIITSPTGAAVQDLTEVLRRRFPPIEIILKPVNVQGQGAAAEIATAIDDFNAYGKVDLLIAGRGGGSLEDLWAFNEEVVARAIFRSKIPIISAVGHEIDFCMSDFVADLRAPTPSAAAELAVPDAAELKARLDSLNYRLKQRLLERVALNQERLNRLTHSYGFRRPADLLHQYEQQLDETTRMLFRAMNYYTNFKQDHVLAHTQRLQALSPQAILKRGYSIVYKTPAHQIVDHAADLVPDENIEIQFYQGKAWSKITKIESNNTNIAGDKNGEEKL